MIDWGLPILHNQTSWVLMSWRHREPCHQQPWHWPCEILLCNTGSWNSIHGRLARASLFCIIKHHGCWRSGDTWSHAISNQDTEPVKSFLYITDNWDFSLWNTRTFLSHTIKHHGCWAWVLITRWHKEPCHQQPWYGPCENKITLLSCFNS